MKKSVLVTVCMMVCFIMVAFAGIANAQSVVTLTWDPNPPAEQVTEYRVFMSQVSGEYNFSDGNEACAGYVGNETCSIPDVADGTYYFVLLAYNSKGASPQSVEVTATIDSLEPPGPPSGLIISAIEKMISALEDLKEYFAQQEEGIAIRIE